MTSDLEFSGERFVPGTPGVIAYEHGHRYAFALRHARGRNVLDAACGEGYGTALLAGVARSVIGVDIDAPSVQHAREAYGGVPNLRFEIASVTALPLPDASVDLVVSFETIEHLPSEEQPRMLAEFARVLAPGGVLVVSSPNRRRYSDDPGYRNPFHLHELYRQDLSGLLDVHFPARHWYHQSAMSASVLWGETSARDGETWMADGRTIEAAHDLDGVYYVVIAAKDAASLPDPEPGLSLFTDRAETEMRKAEAAQGELLRLDALLRSRDASLDAQTGHIHHLEELVAVRERLVEERDRELAACRAAYESRDRDLLAARDALARSATELTEVRQQHERLERAVAAQERIIQYRHSWQWWLQLPWVRVRTWWQRLGGP